MELQGEHNSKLLFRKGFSAFEFLSHVSCIVCYIELQGDHCSKVLCCLWFVYIMHFEMNISSLEYT